MVLVVAIIVVVVVRAVLNSSVLLAWQKGQLAVVDFSFGVQLVVPLSVGLGTAYGGPGLIMGAFVAMAPILVAFLFLQRFWLKNITAGSGV